MVGTTSIVLPCLRTTGWHRWVQVGHVLDRERGAIAAFRPSFIAASIGAGCGNRHRLSDDANRYQRISPRCIREVRLVVGLDWPLSSTRDPCSPRRRQRWRAARDGIVLREAAPGEATRFRARAGIEHAELAEVQGEAFRVYRERLAARAPAAAEER
jgi:hypothetical protein